MYSNIVIFTAFCPVLSDGMSVSSPSRENNKHLGSDGSHTGSREKEDMYLDLLSPMREEKSLLAIKAVSTSR